MTFDLCPSCEGSGFRNKLEGSKCFTCHGFGILEDSDPDDDECDDYVSPEDQKRNDAMERGDYERARAKGERSEQRNSE